MNTSPAKRLLAVSLAACMSMTLMMGIDTLASVERAPTSLLSTHAPAPRA